MADRAPAAVGETPAGPSPYAAELAAAPAGEPAHVSGARLWAFRALFAFGVAQGIVAAAMLPAILAMAGDVGNSPRPGQAVLGLLLALAAALMLAALGARCIQLGRSVRAPMAVPAPGRALHRAAQAAAVLVLVFGLQSLWAGFVVLGVVEVAAAVFGLLAAGAWTSSVPGAKARGSLLAVVAGILWFVATLQAGATVRGSMSGLVEAAFHAVSPPGAAVLVAVLALLAYAIMERSRDRTLAWAGAATAGLLGAVQVLILGLDVIGSRWPPLSGAPVLLFAAFLLALAGILAALVAAVLGLAAAGHALAHYAPPLVARAGAGFMAPPAGAACPRCRLVAPYAAKFCPDCGEAMPASYQAA